MVCKPCPAVLWRWCLEPVPYQYISIPYGLVPVMTCSYVNAAVSVQYTTSILRHHLFGLHVFTCPYMNQDGNIQKWPIYPHTISLLRKRPEAEQKAHHCCRMLFREKRHDGFFKVWSTIQGIIGLLSLELLNLYLLQPSLWLFWWFPICCWWLEIVRGQNDDPGWS